MGHIVIFNRLVGIPSVALLVAATNGTIKSCYTGAYVFISSILSGRVPGQIIRVQTLSLKY